MFVVFDLETTGFDQSHSDVIECAYAVFEDTGIFVRAERLFFYHKGMSWSEDAYAVHQIPLTFLERYEDKFEENVIKLYSILNRNVVVGHNVVNFDCPFARAWLNRQGVFGLDYHRAVDTGAMYKPITKKSRIKLTTLCEKAGLTPEIIENFTKLWFGDTELGLRSHEASYDVTAEALLTLQAINKKLVIFTPILNEKETVEVCASDVLGGDVADDFMNPPEERVHTISITLAENAGELLHEYKYSDIHLLRDVNIPGIFHPVGTRDSGIFANTVNWPWPVTFDRMTSVIRACKIGGVEVLTSQEDYDSLLKYVEEGGDV